MGCGILTKLNDHVGLRSVAKDSYCLVLVELDIRQPPNNDLSAQLWEGIFYASIMT